MVWPAEAKEEQNEDEEEDEQAKWRSKVDHRNKCRKLPQFLSSPTLEPADII